MRVLISNFTECLNLFIKPGLLPYISAKFLALNCDKMLSEYMYTKTRLFSAV